MVDIEVYIRICFSIGAAFDLDVRKTCHLLKAHNVPWLQISRFL